MAFFLGYETALACLRALERIGELERTRAMPKAKSVPDAKLLKSAIGRLPSHLSEAALQTKPTLIILDAESRCRSKEIDTRQFGLPDNTRCFLMLGEELYLASPELCFAQAARRSTEIELMKLGFELCGSYSLDPSRNVGFKNRPALTTKDAILKLLASLPNNCPASARKAIRFVRDGSASPMETCLALFLGLPVRFGGYGLGMPRMNAEIAIGTHSSLSTNHRLYHCDLYWEESQVALEYNSREFHMSEKAAERDASRVNDLLGSGIKSVSVTRKHVADPSKMDIVAHSLAKMMGKRMRTDCTNVKERRADLRRQLFAKDPWQ